MQGFPINIFKKIKVWLVGSDDMSSLYFDQVGLSTLIKLGSILISIILVPMVLGYLNQEKYGIWVTLTTIVQWIRLLDVGMGNGMRNKLSESIALGQTRQGRIFVSTTYVILGAIFLSALMLFYVVNPFLNWNAILNTENISNNELMNLAKVVVTFVVLGFILHPVVLVYTAHGNSAAGGFVQLIISLLSLVLIWVVSKFSEKGNLVLLGWIVTGIPVLVYLFVSAYTFLIRYPQFRPSFRLVRIKQSSNLLKLSAQFFIVQITATITYSSIPFIVAQLFSPNEVTIYSISNSIFNLPIMLISLITAPILPLVTQAFARRDFTWIRSMLRKLNIVSLILVGGTGLMIVLSPIIYKIWIGDKVIIPFGLSLVIGIYTMLSIMVTPYSTFLNGTGRIRLLVILAPVGIATFIGFSILFSRLLDNVIGVPIALSISALVGLLIIPPELRKYLKR